MQKEVLKNQCVLQFVCVNTFKFHVPNCVNIELFMKFKVFWGILYVCDCDFFFVSSIPFNFTTSQALHLFCHQSNAFHCVARVTTLSPLWVLLTLAVYTWFISSARKSPDILCLWLSIWKKKAPQNTELGEKKQNKNSSFFFKKKERKKKYIPSSPKPHISLPFLFDHSSHSKLFLNPHRKLVSAGKTSRSVRFRLSWRHW